MISHSCWKVLLIILLVLTCCYSYAADPPPAASKLSDGLSYLNQLQKQLKSISGYSFSSEITTSENPTFFPNIQEVQGKKGHVSILVSGQKYRFENRRAINPGGEKFHNLTVYDGKTVEQFTYYKRQLALKTGYIPMNSFEHRFTDAFLAPFVWFSDGSFKNELTDPSLDQLKDPEKWDLFTAKIISTSQVNLDGKECIRIEFYYKIPPDPDLNITPEASANMQTRYVVYLSKEDQCYPIGWDRLSMNGVLLSKYRVTNLQTISLNGVSFYCPTIATRYLYGGGFGGGDAMGTHSDSPKMTITTQITSSQINPTPDDSSFTIDPSEADVIVDEDHKTFIKVPR
jgi:outer membrane lipoprotein-sorting protein